MVLRHPRSVLFRSAGSTFLNLPSCQLLGAFTLSMCGRCVHSGPTDAGSRGKSTDSSAGNLLANNGTGLSRQDQAILDFPYELVQTTERLTTSVAELLSARSVALDLEAFCTTERERQLGKISLVQVCCDARPVVYLFDVLTLTSNTFTDVFRSVLESQTATKLFFDCRRDVEALSCQMGVKPRKVRDLQLQYTALQWKLRSNSRRSSMTYVLKHVADIERREGDSAVQTAMTFGNRPVWDVRPLPSHFLEYAAGDVRHILLLEKHLNNLCAEQHLSTDAVERLTASYVDWYAVGKPVAVEPDSRPAEVNAALLERYLGPGGNCAFCGAKGHTEAECFKKEKGATLQCTYCGGLGHTARTCFKKNPQMLKCDLCGQIGHSSANCFKKNPCKHCGGFHSSANCHKHLRSVKYFDIEDQSTP